MPKVLVVDDDPAVLLNTCAYLEDEGYEALEASSGGEALTEAETHTPAIAIVDMRLPDIDGNELIQQLYQRLPEIKVVIHTGSSDYSLPAELTNLGISREQVVRKPVSDMAVFIEVIDRLVQQNDTV